MLFCIRRRELAVTVAGASDEAAADVVLAPVESSFEDSFLYSFEVAVGDVWYDDVLPRSEAKFARAVVVREVTEAKKLFGGNLTDWHRNTEPGKASLLLGESTDVRVGNGSAEGRLLEIEFAS